MNIKTIQIAWYGYYTYDSEKGFKSNNSRNKPEYADKKGLYQIYGNHSIYGNDSLLYIGKTDKSISSRISKHKDSWLYLLQGEYKVCFGQILKTHDNNDSQEKQIDHAEGILIDFYKPSQNVMRKNGTNITNRLLINYGDYGRIERFVGTTYYETQSWKHEDLSELFFKK